MMKRKILVASVLCSISCMNAVMPVYAEENVRKFNLPTVVVEGIRDTLPETYPGGMMARGARAGILGNKDFMDTPFITNAYTSNLIKNSQAQTVAEVAMNDPSVRFQYPSGTLIDNYYIRGFTYNTNNMSMNGLMGLAPYGTVATEMLERVEIQRGPNALVNGMNPGNEVSGNTGNLTEILDSLGTPKDPLAEIEATKAELNEAVITGKFDIEAIEAALEEQAGKEGQAK